MGAIITANPDPRPGPRPENFPEGSVDPQMQYAALRPASGPPHDA
jgi:hypothetical protein